MDNAGDKIKFCKGGDFYISASSEFIYIQPETTIFEATLVMRDNNIGCLPIAGSDSRLVGVVTERDMLKRVLAEGLDFNSTPVKKIVTRDFTSCPSETTYTDMLRLMKDRHIRHLLLTSANKLVSIVSIRDILEKLMHEYEDASQKFKAIAKEWKVTFDSILDGVAIIDTTFNILRANRAFADLCKLDVREVVNRKCHEVLHGFSEPCKNCPNIDSIATKKTETRQVWEPKLNMHLEMTTFPVLEANGTIKTSVCLIKDITEANKAQQALQEAKTQTDLTNKQLEQAIEKANELARQAEQANNAKSEFLANMSHEIRTPLNSIVGFADLMSEEKLSDSQVEYIEVLRRSAKNLTRIIDDIFDFSKLNDGAFKIRPENCDLNKILAQVGLLMREKAVKKGLYFELIRNGALPAEVFLDGDRLMQCLVNLIDNAIKFTESGNITVSVSVEKNNGDDLLVFDVEDTGIGIPEDKIETIYDSFTQIDSSSNKKYEGTGMGLAITRQIVHLMNGTLTCQSRQQQGSVFSLAVPANSNFKSTQQAENDTPQQQPDQPLSGRVLVAEDTMASQTLIKIILERMALEPVIAENGREALKLVFEQDFDLVILDIVMPEINGYQVMEKLRDKNPDIPVIALTANALKGDREKCLSVGCTEYLPKPVDRCKLEKIIRKLLTPAVAKSASSPSRQNYNDLV